MANKIDICNSALSKLGVDPISSFTEKSKEAFLCSELYNKIRKSLLRSHKWNFSTKRVTLLADSLTFVDANVNIVTSEITIAAHGKNTGDRISLSTTGVLPTGLQSGREYFVIKISATLVKLALTFADSQSGTFVSITAATGGGTHTATALPQWGKGSIFSLPNDNLLVTQVGKDNSTAHKIEGEKIIANTTELNIKYVFNLTDVDLFDSTFFEAFAWLLASELAFPLFQSANLALAMNEKAKEVLGTTQSFDAGEDTPDEWDDPNSWTSSRRTRPTSGFNDNF